MSNLSFIIKNKPSYSNIKHVVLYALPKIGKTTAVSLIPNNVILAFEDQSFFVEADIIDMRANNDEQIKNKLKELPEYVKSLKEAGYKFITIDTLSSMLPFGKYLGEALYSKTLIGKNWFSKNKAEYGDLLNLPKGLGYEYLRQGINRIYDYLFDSGLKVITVAHVKEKYSDETGNVSMLDIDAPGSLSRSIAKDAQIVGYLTKKKKDEVWISFKNFDNTITGTIIKELQDTEILLTKREDDKIISNWDEILKYIS
ncbi:MAG: hypothetical protein KatS3mg002_1326 [Candidatus Woesearchaeota archaeon]|nr:MAG: hypothetical protein KatS3mg002_1326 [Candidatus Woesearchaeota archaeon]